MEREFNLIDEPWICVRDKSCAVREVSLRDALCRAHEYRELAGETKAQDVAVLRLLLAIVHTVFSRYDVDGEEIDRENMDEGEALDAAFEAWERIWREKRIPEKPVKKYFDKWHDRFWLFDEEHPFYQSNGISGGDSGLFNTLKMIGSIIQSNNSNRMFADRKGDLVQTGYKGKINKKLERTIPLEYSEAARWLIYIKCFDDKAIKPKASPTWESKLGLIYVEGNNLFETLMLNYVADADVDNGVYSSVPLWERDDVVDIINRLIPVPRAQAELLTVKSRIMSLVRNHGHVIGFYDFSGDYFEEEQVFTEQMTLWKCYDEGNIKRFRPLKYDPSLKAWQEFGSIAVSPIEAAENKNDKQKHMPGVIRWVKLLCGKNALDNDYIIKAAIVAIIFDKKRSPAPPVRDILNDSISFHSFLLTKLGKVWRSRIEEEIEKCAKAAGAVRFLSINLQFACGASGDGITGDDAKMSFYDQIDRPFRIWLAELDPEYGEEYTEKLEKELSAIALRTGSDIASRAGGNAIFGRYVNGGKTVSSSAEALNIYVYQIRKIFNKAGDI